MRKVAFMAILVCAAFSTGACAADIKGGGAIAGGPTVVTIISPTGFTRAGESYRHCGTKLQF